AARAAGVTPGPVGILKDCWVTDDRVEADAVRRRMHRHYREEAGSWWILKGEHSGFERPDLLDAQLRRVDETALVGTAAEGGGALAGLRGPGIDTVAPRVQLRD